MRQHARFMRLEHGKPTLFKYATTTSSRRKHRVQGDVPSVEFLDHVLSDSMRDDPQSPLGNQQDSGRLPQSVRR